MTQTDIPTWLLNFQLKLMAALDAAWKSIEASDDPAAIRQARDRAKAIGDLAAMAPKGGPDHAPRPRQARPHDDRRRRRTPARHPKRGRRERDADGYAPPGRSRRHPGRRPGCTGRTRPPRPGQAQGRPAGEVVSKTPRPSPRGEGKRFFRNRP